MPGKVRVLDELTANQIAAGEVVERPASVVKELVENALDAGSSRIAVDLAEGGIEGITVQDDGCGMSEEDLLLAVERHATSKIGSAEDLWRITTLGFRGEALPSIAAVARLEIVTREPQAVAGSRLVVRGGRRIEAGPAGSPAGTRARVSELFFNTPARRKHLRRAGVELGYCLQALTGLALAHHRVAFRVRHNGRVLLETSGGGDFREAVAEVFGRELAEQMLPVSWEDGGIALEGLAAPPAAARGSRSHEFFFVNGRVVAAAVLRHALEQAYRGLLPLHRYPVAVLHLTLNPADLDVNIHPGKLQVRFANEAAVVRSVREAVERALAARELTPRVSAAWGAAERVSEASVAYRPERDLRGLTLQGTRHPAAPAEHAATLEHAAAAVPPRVPDDRPPSAGAPEQAAGALKRWPELRVVGQVAGSYIIAEGAGGVYIVDQHAAHERLQFERFRSRLAAGASPVQSLAVPISIHLTPQEMALWQERAAVLEGLGFMVEAFGGTTVLVRGVPALFAGRARAAFLSALDHLGRHWPPGPGGEAGPAWEYAYAAMAACRASVKAGDPLRREEMEELLAELGRAANPFTCPHGRPTILQMTFADLERHFRRT